MISPLRRLTTALAFALAAGALTPTLARAQQETTLATAGSTCDVSSSTPNCVLLAGFHPGVAVQVTGTATATVSFEASSNGVTWVAQSLTPNTGSAASSATAAGRWTGTVGGAFRVRMSAYTSGAFRVRIDPLAFAPTAATSSGASFDGVLLDAAGGDAITDTTNNALRVNVVAGAAAGGTSSNFGAAVPAAGTAAGGSDGTNMQLLRLSDLDSGAGTEYVAHASLRIAASGGSIPITAGAGAVAAGTPRVTLGSDDPAVASLAVIDNIVSGSGVNISQINGVTPLMGAGNTGTGSPRVTITADQAGFGGAAAAVADDTATPTVWKIATFPHIWDGATWDRLPGTSANGLTVNTEFAAAAALSDNFANPTTSSVFALMGCWDGSTWDRCVTSADPCVTGTKVFQNINQTTGTQLFTGTASNRTYVCSINLVTATAQNIALVSGTGSVCATGTAGMFGGTTAATGWNFAANGGLTAGNGGAALTKSGANADNVCLLQSSTGQISGSLSYVVAP